MRPQSFYATSTDMEAINDGFSEMIKRYPTLTVPVGILFGKGDQLLDYRLHGQATKDQVPNLDLKLMEGGHMLPVTSRTRSPLSSGGWRRPRRRKCAEEAAPGDTLHARNAIFPVRPGCMLARAASAASSSG